MTQMEWGYVIFFSSFALLQATATSY